ncbi:hypothetical protein Tco_0004645 [Tanacetum coccineum]
MNSRTCPNVLSYGELPNALQQDVVTLLKRIRKFSITQDIGARAPIHIFNRISFAIAKREGAQIVLADEEKAKAIAFDEINKSPEQNKRRLTPQVAEKTVRTLDVLHGHAGNLCVQNRTRKEMQRKITGLSSQSAVLTTYRQELMTMPVLLERCNSGRIRRRAKWRNDDYICRGHILNGMSDSLFDVYTNVESAKELWDSLESKYMAEDSSSKNSYDLSLVQLGSHLRIEESLRAHDSDKGKGKEVGGPSVK